MEKCEIWNYWRITFSFCFILKSHKHFGGFWLDDSSVKNKLSSSVWLVQRCSEAAAKTSWLLTSRILSYISHNAMRHPLFVRASCLVNARIFQNSVPLVHKVDIPSSIVSLRVGPAITLHWVLSQIRHQGSSLIFDKAPPELYKIAHTCWGC